MALMLKSGVFGKATVAQPPRRAVVRPARLVICNSYQNKENIDLTNLSTYARHESDCGSSEVQVARLTARIKQISTHLAQNRKDYAARRGLEAVLSQRKSLLQYLHKHDRAAYTKLVTQFGIRSVIVGDTRGAARKKEVNV